MVNMWVIKKQMDLNSCKLSSFYVKWYRINSKKTEKLKMYTVFSMVTTGKSCRSIAKKQIDKQKQNSKNMFN